MRVRGKIQNAALLASAVVASCLAFATSAWASGTPPAFVNFEGPTGANQVAVRPPTIGPYDVCEPGFEGSKSAGGTLSWRKWTATRAVGTGALWVATKCGATSSEKGYPATLALSDVKTLRVREFSSSGHVTTRTVRAFTATRVRFTRSVPDGWARSRTYHLIRTHGTDYYYSFASGW